MRPQEQIKATFTKIASSKSNITKAFFREPDENGKLILQKKGGGELWEGTATLCESTLKGFVDLIMSRDDAETPWVAVYGTPTIEGTEWELITQKKANEGISKDQITRTRKHFAFREGEPGFLVLDYDPPKFMPDKRDEEILTKIDLTNILYDVMPEWKERDVQFAIVDSTSTYIYEKDTNTLLRGEGGKRVITEVADASKIPIITEELIKRLWLNGYGRHKISKSGALIKTTIFDDCYGKQPERVDFTPAGAACDEQDIYQKRPEPFIWGSNVLVSGDIRWTKETKVVGEKIKAQQDADRERRSIDAKPIREAYKATKVKEMIKRNSSLTESEAKIQVEALYKGELGTDILIYVEGIDDPVSAGEIMEQPEYYHNKRCWPPLDEDDADYQRFCAIIYSNQSDPVIHTFAHGNIVYKLPCKMNLTDARKEWVFPFTAGNDEGAKALTEELIKTDEFFQKLGEKTVFMITSERTNKYQCCSA